MSRGIWIRLYLGKCINQMVMRKITYFINPISGTKDKAGLEKKLLESTMALGISAAIEYTNAAGDYSYLPAKIAKEKITDIVVCGGDGSINQIGQHLISVDVNIGIIPMGSGNGLAFTAGIPKAIEQALAIIFHGEAKLIDGFYINDKFSCMLCGLGLDAQVAADFAQRGKRGLINYIRQSSINFFTAKPYPFEVEIGKLKFNTYAYFISIANSNQFGNHFTIAPQASLNDGLLDIVIVKKMNKIKMLWTVLKQIKTGKVIGFEDETNGNADLLYFQSAELSVKNPGMAPLHIDGEVVPSANFFQIKIIPEAIRLIQPKSFTY